MNVTPTFDVYFELPQAPDASERLLAAYEMLLGERTVGDNPFDTDNSHPIMPHAEHHSEGQHYYGLARFGSIIK